MHARMFPIQKKLSTIKATAIHGPNFLEICKRGTAKEAQKYLTMGVSTQTMTRENNTALHLATYYKNIEVIKLLLDRHANFYFKNNQRQDPFYLACLTVPPCVEQKEFAQSIDDFESILRLYLDHGFNINHTEKKEESYLGLLAGLGAIEAAKLLVSYGANVVIEDHEGLTPIHHATKLAQYADRQIEIVKFLLNQGVHPITINQADNSPEYVELKRILDEKFESRRGFFN